MHPPKLEPVLQSGWAFCFNPNVMTSGPNPPLLPPTEHNYKAGNSMRRLGFEPSREVSRVSRDGLESRRPALCAPVSYRKADLEWPLLDQEVKMCNFTPRKRKKCLKTPSPTLWKLQHTQPWPHVSHLSIALGHLFTYFPYPLLPGC